LKLENSILKVLVYFDLFDFPLFPEEIFIYLDQPVNMADILQILESLRSNGGVFRFKDLYSIRNDEKLSVRRIKGTQRAQLLLPFAKNISGFLFTFPFVRGIAISGSLSKNFAAEDADIDYFIITKMNRLWIARTCMHLFKKLSFLRGRQHQYCMNYYIDEKGLEIPEKNLFTAIELITLMPVLGDAVIDTFFKTNDWVNGYYPNHISKNLNHNTGMRHSRIKNLLEFLLDNRVGDWLDNYFMKLTTRRWKKKELYQKRSYKGTRMGLSTGKHFSKPNPVFFQEKILQMYTDRLNLFTSQWRMLQD